jgi:hypothetical protein
LYIIYATGSDGSSGSNRKSSNMRKSFFCSNKVAFTVSIYPHALMCTKFYKNKCTKKRIHDESALLYTYVAGANMVKK